MSAYPPPVHVLRDLAPGVVFDGEAHGSARVQVRPTIAAASGRIAAGPIAMLVDVLGGGLAARAARPDWIATADLTVHLVSAPTSGTLEATGRVARKGRTTIVLDVDLSDGVLPVGCATMTFAVLERRDDNIDILNFDNDPERPASPLAISDGDFSEPFGDALGIRTIDAASGVLEGPVNDYSLNTLGAMQGGAVATLMCQAADAALTAACGAPMETVDLHLTYLALNRHGPIRTRTSLLSVTPSHGSMRVDTVDANGRITATAGIVACAPGGVR